MENTDAFDNVPENELEDDIENVAWEMREIINDGKTDVEEAFHDAVAAYFGAAG